MAKGLKALQDVKKMRRSVRLHESTDPAAVAVILGTILKEAIALKQMSDGFVGRGAVNELRNIRRDLVAGSIDAGSRKAEFISKYTLVLNQLKDADDEEKKEIGQERKEKLSNFIPSKESLVSAVMTANPVLGYGVKIATDLMSRSPEKQNRKNRKQEKIQKVKNLASEESGLVNQKADIEQQLNNGGGGGDSQELGEKRNEIQSRLDLIREELKHLNEIIERDALSKLERIDESSGHTNENLERIHKTDKNQLAFDKANAAQESLLARENKTESGSYLGAGAIGGLVAGGGSEGKNDLISGTMDDVMDNIQAGAVGGGLGAGLSGALGFIGRSILPFVFKFALPVAIGYGLWYFKDEIKDFILNDLRGWLEKNFDLDFSGLEKYIKDSSEDHAKVKNDPRLVELEEKIADLVEKKNQILSTDATSHAHQRELQDRANEVQAEINKLQDEKNVIYDGLRRDEAENRKSNGENASGNLELDEGSLPDGMMPPEEIDRHIRDAAEEYDIDPNILRGMAYQESRFNPDAYNSQFGATGLFQYIPATARAMGIDPTDPRQSAFATAEQFRGRLDKGESVEEAVRHHHGGPNRNIWGENNDNYWNKIEGYIGNYLEAENPQASYMSELANDQLMSFENNSKNNGGGGNGSPTVIAPSNQSIVNNNEYKSGSPKSATNMDPTWWRLRERNTYIG